MTKPERGDGRTRKKAVGAIVTPGPGGARRHRARRAEWGLLKHYWVLTKLVLVLVGTAILLVHLRTAVEPMARAVATSGDAALSSHAFGALPNQLIVHPAGGLLVLLVATALSVWKPWGRTGYGKPEGRAARGGTE